MSYLSHNTMPKQHRVVNKASAQENKPSDVRKANREEGKYLRGKKGKDLFNICCKHTLEFIHGFSTGVK